MKDRKLVITLVIGLLFVSSVCLSSSTVSKTLFDATASEVPSIEYFKISATIDNSYAVTQFEEKLSNPYSNPVDATFTVQIPENAFISNLTLEIGGKTFYGKILPKDEAQTRYNQSVAVGRNAGLVASKGRTLFSYSASLSANTDMVVKFRYEEILQKNLGIYEYNVSLESSSYAQAPKNLDVEVQIKSTDKIVTIQTPGNSATTISCPSSYDATVIYCPTGPHPCSLAIDYEIESPPRNGRLLSYSDGEEGFFMHIFSPQLKEIGGEALDKEIIFVLDRTGSMDGEKISQMRDAFGEVVNQLHPGDVFNIIMFNTEMKVYQFNVIPANEYNKDAAVTYINGFDAQDCTDINQALLLGLSMFSESSNKSKIIVFLTDGLPTAGETTDTTQIRKNVKAANEKGVSIFSLGFGDDVDFEFLKALSLENHGHATKIYVDKDASSQITNFYATISTPLLKNVSLNYSDNTYEVFTRFADHLFDGSDIVVLGKYKPDSTDIKFNGTATSKNGIETFSQTFVLDKVTEHAFIPRHWAFAKIIYLLDKITVDGEQLWMISEILMLSTKYGFVTPYTSLYIDTSMQSADNPDNSNTSGNPNTSGNGGGNGYIPNQGGAPPANKGTMSADGAALSSMVLCIPLGIIGLVVVVVIIFIVTRKKPNNKQTASQVDENVWQGKGYDMYNQNWSSDEIVEYYNAKR